MWKVELKCLDRVQKALLQCRSSILKLSGHLCNAQSVAMNGEVLLSPYMECFVPFAVPRLKSKKIWISNSSSSQILGTDWLKLLAIFVLIGNFVWIIFALIRSVL